MEFLHHDGGFEATPHDYGPLPPDDLESVFDVQQPDGMGNEHPDSPSVLSILEGTTDPSHLGATQHLHLELGSTALDSNDNGVSDAVEAALGRDPLAHGYDALPLAGFKGPNADGDPWPDWVEEALGTDSHEAGSHPTLVEAHHYPEGSGENLPGSYDIPLPPMP